MKRLTANSSEGGFTIFEVLVSVVLLGIGVVALASLQIIGMRGNVAAEDRTKAMSVATAKLSEISSYTFFQNMNTGEVVADARLTAAGRICQEVNQSCLTREEIRTRAGLAEGAALDDEQFRYTLCWTITDQGDLTQPGSFKQITIDVSWSDRASKGGDDVVSISLTGLPLTAKYM